MTQIVDGVPIRSYETTDRSKALGQRLAEGTHDEVDVLRHAEVVAHATSLTAEDTQSVGLIDHDGGIVFLLQFHNLGQGSQVAFHGEDTVHDDELHLVGLTALQHALQVLHVVVLVAKLGGKGQTAAIHDAGMVAVVADDVVILAHQLGNNTAVDGKSRGNAQGIILAHVGSQFLLQLHVDVEGAVQKAASGTAAAILLHGLATCLDDAVVTCKSSVCVRTEHQHVVTSHFYFSTLLTLDGAKIGINALFLDLLCERKEGMPDQFFF